MNRSPSSSTIFQKDCRQLQAWMDGREMQLCEVIETSMNLEEVQNSINLLEQVYYSTIQQLLPKLTNNG